jgi:ATP-binding cassette, subfamily B (MDR/TAP), member 1
MSIATPGAVVNVFMAIIIDSVSLAQLVPTGLQQSYTKLLTVSPISTQPILKVSPEKVKGHITFENVEFNYPSTANVLVLRDLPVTFPAGKTGALIGASGSGKSTVITLVERFYDPLSGVVKLDGVDLKDLKIKWLCAQIGLVSQEPTLFLTTIKANVAHGLICTVHEHASEEEQFSHIKATCVKANADGSISDMPNGYKTMVGKCGFLMSGGQKQCIAIAQDRVRS